MSQQSVELNQGEVKINFNEVVPGKVSLKELGFTNDDLYFENGLLRLVLNFDKLSGFEFYQVPTIELVYKEEMGETHWQTDYNGETISDKLDHHGHSTVILLNRTKIENLEQHHENRLLIHGEFPAPVHLDAENSFINIFK